MKVQIRKGVFETNSSSVHSLTMCTAKEWEDWTMGRTMFMPDNCSFLPVKEAEEYNCKVAEENDTDFSDPSAVYWGCYYLSYDNFTDYFCEFYDTFKEEKDGIVAFGYYGTDY